jgi:hypothetical protein
MPIEPCPSCLEKLNVRLGIDPVRRALAVESAYLDAGLVAPALHAVIERWRDAGVRSSD